MSKEPVTEYKLTVRICVEEDGPDGDYYSYCPDIGGVYSVGKSEEETFINTLDALSEYFAMSFKNDDSIPDGVLAVGSV